MADLTFDQLPAAASVNGTETLPIMQGGVSKRTVLGATGFNSSHTWATLKSMATGGTLIPHATYVPSDIGEEFFAEDANTLTPKYTRVRCSLPGFGGVWDGVANDSPAIQAANNYAASFTPPRPIELPPNVGIKDSVFITTGVYVYGHEYESGQWLTTIRPCASSSYSTGFMLNFNTLNGTTPNAAITKGAAFQNGLFGVFITNFVTNYANIRVAVFAGTFIARDIRQSGLNQLIKKVDNQYVDNIEIGRIFSWVSHDQSEYMIDIGSGGGDALHIYNCNFPAEVIPEPAIKLSGKGGVRISDIINGSIYLVDCSPALVENYHNESGQIVIKGSNVTIDNGLFEAANGITGYPITCETATYTQSQYFLAITNCTFIYGDPTHRNAWPAEVNLQSQYKLTVENAYREVRVGAAKALQGLRVHENVVLVSTWEANSFYLSRQGAYIKPFADGTYTTKLGASVNGISFTSVLTDAGISTFVPGTYYYTAQVLLDSTTGKNQTSGEKNAVVGSGQIVSLSTGLDTDSTSSRILRVYRGAATGSYNNVADIPLVTSIQIIDEGNFVSNVAWTPRTAGPVDTLTTTTVGNYTVTPLTGAKLITPFNTQSVAYSSTLSVNLALGNKVVVGELTGALTHNSPTNVPAAETEVRYEFTQDGTGGRGITWSALHKGAWPTASGTANQKKVVIGRSAGTTIIFVSDSGWY